ERPTALCDLPQGGTWFVPGGRSTMGRLFADAGICYLWKDNGDKGSLSLTFEGVFDRARDADWWLIKQGWPAPPSRKMLADEFPHAERFKAWHEGHVLVCNTLATPYFEEVPFHPERLLQELAAIFHPTLRPEGFTPRYFNYLEK
ncbi:MAG: ABC transporter substrate-binding protein, partial [Alloprevotella sp.]